MPTRALRSPLTLAVLSMLREAPRHPYEMQALLRERHVGAVVKLRGGSLYDAVGRLERAGLIESRETQRHGGRPERTLYALTDAGDAELDALLRDILATPVNEYPRFVAGIAHLLSLPPDEVTDLLRQRAAALEAEFAATAKQLAEVRRHDLPRVTLLEVEYVQTLRRTEIRWLAGVADDIAAGDLPWPSPDEPT